MGRTYFDTFAGELVDESEMEIIAPPERYILVDEEEED